MALNKHISNILLRVQGDVEPAKKKLDGLVGALKAYGRIEEEATADVDIQGLDKLTLAKEALREFSREEAVKKINVDEGKALSKIEALQNKLNGLRTQDYAASVDTAGRNALEAQIADARKALQQLAKQNPKLTLDVDKKKLEADIAVAERKLAALARPRDKGRFIKVDKVAVEQQQAAVDKLYDRLRILDTQDPEVTFALKIEKAQANLNKLEARLAAMPDETDLRIKVESEVAKAQAEVLALIASIDVLTARKRKIELEVDVDKNRNLKSFGRSIEQVGALSGSLGAVFGAVSKGATNLASKVGTVTVNLGAFGVKLGPVVALILGLAGAIVASLVAALGLLATALAAATVAVAGLATAFAAALGPAIALAVAGIARFVQIFKAASALQKAQDAATRKTTEGTKALAEEENRRRDAVQAVASALRGVTAGERNLTKARKDAAKALIDANAAQDEAQREVVNSNAELKQSTVDAYDAIAQSALDARNALLSVEDARLGIQEADLAVQEAELNLKAFRNSAGLAGQAFNDLFKKSTDIASNVDVSGLASKFTGAGADDNEALKAQKLVLALRRAKLNEKQANNQLEQSEDDLTAARKRQNDFARRGINAFEPYRAALERQRESNLRLRDATAKVVELEKVGIAQSPQVLAATDSLIAANERLRQSRVDLNTVGEGGIADDLAKARQDIEKLPKGMQALVFAVVAAKPILQAFFDPAVQSIIDGMNRGVEHVKKTSPLLLLGLKGAFIGLGTAVGEVFDGIGKAASSPAALLFFISLTNAAAELTRIIGGPVFQALAGILAEVATAAMPYLISGFKRLAKFLQNMSKAAEGPGLDTFFGKAIEVLNGLWDLIKAVAGVFGAFFTATESSSVSFLAFLTNAANQLKRFVENKDNQEAIANFFRDILPLVKEVGIFLVQFVVFIARLIQILAPALTGILKVVNIALAIFNGLLGVLTPILQLVLTLGLAFFGGPGALAAGVGKALAMFAGFLGLGEIFDTTFGIVTRFTERFIAAVGEAVQAALDFFGSIPDRLFGLLDVFFNFGVSLGDMIVKALESIDFTNLGKKIANKINPFGDPFDVKESAPRTPPKPPPGAGDSLFKFFPPGSIPRLTPTPQALKNSAVALPGGGRPTTYIEKQDVILPPAPGHDQLGDPSDQAQKLADEMARRGRGR